MCRTRLLKGRGTGVVWGRFENNKGLTENRVFISTYTSQTGLEVLRAYARRWPIEPMINQLKQTFGCGCLWQKKLRTLLGWMHIKWQFMRDYSC